MPTRHPSHSPSANSSSFIERRLSVVRSLVFSLLACLSPVGCSQKTNEIQHPQQTFSIKGYSFSNPNQTVTNIRLADGKSPNYDSINLFFEINGKPVEMECPLLSRCEDLSQIPLDHRDFIQSLFIQCVDFEKGCKELTVKFSNQTVKKAK